MAAEQVRDADGGYLSFRMQNVALSWSRSNLIFLFHSIGSKPMQVHLSPDLRSELIQGRVKGNDANDYPNLERQS